MCIVECGAANPAATHQMQAGSILNPHCDPTISLDIAKYLLGATITLGCSRDLLIPDLNYSFPEMSESLSTNDGTTHPVLKPEESISADS